MRKIPTLFQRNIEGDRRVRDEVTPGCEWVLAGEGEATRKFDGTCCLVRDGKLYKRYDAKRGKNPPPDFEPAQAPDPVTGHWPGWVPVANTPENKYHLEAWVSFLAESDGADGTYELIGPKINGNPERESLHSLVPHGCACYQLPDRSFEGVRRFLESTFIEGIVFHHPDGRMTKIKRRDFGMPWPVTP